MRTLLLALVACLAPFAGARAAAAVDTLIAWRVGSQVQVDHAPWTAFLGVYVEDTAADGINRVRYKAVTADDRARLDAYIDTLASMDPTVLSRAAGFAYWTNLYNALTVRLVLDRYPIKSIRNIRPSLTAFGPWKMKIAEVNGIALSLDDIEHGILRAGWKDPRIHYALNCASLGCPNLRKTAFEAAALEGALDDAARQYINHPRGVRFDDAGRLVVSSIYRWFRDDFGKSDNAVIAHLRLYAEPALNDQLARTERIASSGYDWAINDAP